MPPQPLPRLSARTDSPEARQAAALAASLSQLPDTLSRLRALGLFVRGLSLSDPGDPGPTLIADALDLIASLLAEELTELTEPQLSHSQQPETPTDA